MNELVSVIIPSYNRFTYLLNAIASVKAQTYTNIEIIVVNDNSTQPDYATHDFSAMGVQVLHLPKSSKEVHGFACPGGHQRNFGMMIASGKYVAFCDDDDSWFPEKLALQVSRMSETGCKMSCTEALCGIGPYDFSKTYQTYNTGVVWDCLCRVFQSHKFLKSGSIPLVWDLSDIKVINTVICSSVMIEKSVTYIVGNFKIMNNADDYEYWRRILEHTNCVYIPTPCMYYDMRHGDGQNY